MRLFLALEIPPPVVEEVAAAVAAEQARLPAARWVQPQLLHLTLVFLGETGPSLLPALEEAAARAFAGRRPFGMAVRGAGTFPPGRPARVLWLGVEDKEPGALASLQSALAEALAGAVGFVPERRPFHAHLTLARCRKPWGRRGVEAFLRAFDRAWGEAFVAERGVLIESRLGGGGPRYRTVAPFPLGDAA